jgi:23S rRNA (adenine2503-C2)-methyltransferase
MTERTPETTTPPAPAPTAEGDAAAERMLRRATLPDGRVDLKSLDREGVFRFLRSLDVGAKSRDRGRSLQAYKWTWQRGSRSFADLWTITKEARAALDAHAVLSWLELDQRLESDDGTVKYLWRLADGSRIESVLIPDEDREGGGRLTLCVSTQVGCAMACTFCLTGDLGLKRNLTPAEIANQPLQVQQDIGAGRRITNIVMMGMGEPLHNYDNVIVALHNMLDGEALNFSHRRVTVSTEGLVPAMERLAHTLPVNIAVSLNASTEAQRRQVMPITARYSMTELMDCCRKLPLPSGKRITFEYVMMAGFNDSLDDARRVVALMDGVPSKVNLIPYNENPDRDIRRPSDEGVKAFQDLLVKQGIQCSVRTTRGRDISAACGQLGKAAEILASRLPTP